MSSESIPAEPFGTRRDLSLSWVDSLLVFVVPLLLTICGLVFVWLQGRQRGYAVLAMMWSFVCLLCGALVGFLFGIPKVLQAEQSESPTRSAVDTRLQHASYHHQVNTNLEQISDWLTKMIVGIGLIELRDLPDLINRASGFIAKSLESTVQASSQDQGLAAAIIVYFAVAGFLSGYLMTRVYLAGALKRADTGEDRKLSL